MQFAINYSRPAAELYQAGKIPVDRFKCPNWPELIAEVQAIAPAAVHFGFDAGAGQLAEVDWDPAEKWLQAADTPYVNLHLAPMVADFPTIPQASRRTEHLEQVTETLIADVRRAVDRFGPQRVIIENVPCYGIDDPKVLQAGVEPQVIRTVIETTGTGLLLDISHARIAANTLGMDDFEYMEALPVERTRELHFTGLHKVDGRLRDHLEVLDTDWPVLEEVLARIRQGEWGQPWLLAFEYGGVGEKFAWRTDPQVIAAQVPRLYQVVHGTGSGFVPGSSPVL